MIADLHVHTEYSCDSEADMEQYVKQAISKEMSVICFAEHVDLNPNDYGFNYYKPTQFLKNTIKLKRNTVIISKYAQGLSLENLICMQIS